MNQEQLKSRLYYNPETGLFTWLSDRIGMKPGSVAGTTDAKGYTSIVIDGKAHKAHILAYLYMTGLYPSNQVDHRNGERSDNRWDNLRTCTNTENQWNSRTPSNNTSGVKGVSWNKRERKWRARVAANGKVHYIGAFKELEDAKEAIIHARELLHGEFTNHG